MLSSSIRPLLFLFLLLTGFWIGWEFLLAFFIFLVASGRYFWEHIFIGFIMDIVFVFPAGLFIVIFSLVLAFAYFSNDFLKADSIFLKSSRAFIFCAVAISLYSIAYFYTYWPGLVSALKFSTINFSKVFLISFLFLLLSDLTQLLFAPKKVY